MRTPKIEALHRLIIWYNQKHGTQILLLVLDEYKQKAGYLVC